MQRSEYRDVAAPFRCRLARVLLVGALALFAGIAGAEEPANASRTTAAKETAFTPAEEAPIVVWNRTLITLRSPFGGLTPAQRAEAAEHRFRDQLDTMRPERLSSTWVQTDDAAGVLIREGTEVLFGILTTDVDGDRAAVEREGERVVAEIRRILAARAEAHRLPKLLRAIGVSALALLVFVALVWAAGRARHDLHRRIDALAAHRAARNAKAGLDLRPIAWGALRLVVDLLRLAVVLGLAYLALSLVLRQFSYTQPWGETLGGFVFDAATRLGNAFVASIPSLATLVLIWLVTRGIVRIVGAWFGAIESGALESEWLDGPTAGATRRLVVTGIWLFALTVAYPYIPGSETAAFKGVSVFVGLMLSLGSAGALSQIVSGFVVLYSRAIRVGDFVRVGDHEGVVIELGLLSLKLVTRRREEITVPNTLLAGTPVENYTRHAREKGLIVSTAVTIGYDTPWRQVHALLQLAASRTPDVQSEPAPFVLQTALADFYTQYQLNVVIARPTERPFVLSRLHAEIQDAFNEFGVQIMSPNFEAQPEQKVWVPRDAWHAEPAPRT
ncbi:MAG: mechanosensitive ion channel family protein [Rhodanobacteraceae bacterium]